ncbi:MAG: serine dehydratase subunit alpha family protein [Clostridia bacterium]|nr:serine dehydratase subunit alpha family protein [Clostridia bacterium]
MERNSTSYSTYVKILNKELAVAMGCTEPIAVAYCAAKARAVLGAMPEKAEIEVSGNILKNVKSVVVPNTCGRRGIAAAAAVGIVAGDEKKELEVIADVDADGVKRLGDYLDSTPISVCAAKTELVLYICVKAFAGADSSCVVIKNHHTGIARIEKNGEVIFESEPVNPADEAGLDYGALNMADIYDFAESADINDIKDLLLRQVTYNVAVAEEGIRNSYGANIGKVLLSTYGNDVKTRARAMAAAASDARMGGCELPVVINSGSGNQGITISIPIYEYAKEWNASEERLVRALALANLTAIHLKKGMGRLSAFCGAVSAATAAGAGIAYLGGGDLKVINHTLVNSLAIASGIVCDGAKASCAAKIASSIDAALTGYYMYREGQQFYANDGIIFKGVENTINSVNEMVRDGMKGTDDKIIELMTRC